MKKLFILLMVVALLVGTISGQTIKKVKITEVEKIIKESKTPLIINMWATWCGPCVEEIPYFISEVRDHNSSLAAGADSIQLLLVSLDFKEAFPKDIASFVEKRNFAARIFWLDETNADYFCPKVDAKWQGAIPATLFINNKTGYRNFFEEKISHEELKKQITAILK
ncbi:MAG TPA: thioredoxin domain-containing protein [Chitinophagaceae bacterium]|nr:thioredoxin domain-containing protein [Chitinophagaceae bacterium]